MQSHLLYRWISFAVATLLFADAASASAADMQPPALRIALRPNVQARAPRVLLGQIADVTSTDLVLLRKALALPLGWAPKVGESTQLEQEAVQRWLQARMNLRADQVQWEGGTVSVISSLGQTIAWQTLVSVAQDAANQHVRRLLERGAWPAVSVSVQPSQVPADTQVPLGDIQMVVRPLGATALTKRVTVWVDLLAGERLMKSVPVRFEVEAMVRAARAGTDLSAGRPLDPGQLRAEPVDLAAAALPADAGFLSPDDVRTKSLQLRRGAQSGDIVSTQHVRPTPEVERGQLATLVLAQGAMLIESRVEALEDGRTGQTVRVRRQGSAQPTTARVSGPGRVEMLP